MSPKAHPHVSVSVDGEPFLVTDLAREIVLYVCRNQRALNAVVSGEFIVRFGADGDPRQENAPRVARFIHTTHGQSAKFQPQPPGSSCAA